VREGWTSKPFESCIEKVTYSRKVQRKDFLDEGAYPVVSQEEGLINGYWDDPTDLFRVGEPVVVFGDHTKVLKYIDFDFVLGADGVKVLRPQRFLVPKFFFYQLQAAELGTLGYARHYRLLRQLEIAYPSPPEQRRIVRVLDEAFGGVAGAKANAERNLQSTQLLFDCRMESLLATRGPGWEEVTLQALLDRGWIEGHLDGNHGSDYPRKAEFFSEGVPYVSANCLRADGIDMGLAKHLSPSRAALMRKGVAKNGDVLFAHNATVGPVAILRTAEDKVILSTSLTYYRCNQAHILPEYLAHYMRSSAFRRQYLQVMQQSTRNQVPITKQREFFHLVPPLADQRLIVEQLDGLLNNCQVVGSIYQRKLAALDALKQSLLHQAFTGQLGSEAA
jgi:hypothetical protein